MGLCVFGHLPTTIIRTSSLWFQKYFIFYPLPGDDDIQVDFFFQTDWFNHHLHFGILTWQWKIPLFNREYIFKRSLFHCHVSLPEGNQTRDVVRRTGCAWQLFAFGSGQHVGPGEPAKIQVSSVQNPGCFSYIADYTTQLFRDDNKPI